MRFTRLIALAVAALIALAACSGAASTPAPTAPPAAATAAPTAAPATGGGAGTAVAIQNFAFDPLTVAAKLGEKVTWTNGDSTKHTVTFDDATVTSSGEFDGGATFSQTFTKAGSFAYHCAIHPNMKGTVTAS